MLTKTGQSIVFMVLSFLLTVLPPVPVLAQQNSQHYSTQYLQIVPPSWAPSLDQVAEFLEETVNSDAQTSQQALNRIGQNLADLRDAQLFIVYMKLMQHLDAGSRISLFKEQEHWLKQRKEKAQASVVSQGGTLAALEYSDTFRKVTEERLRELQARLLKYVAAKPSQPFKGE